MGKFRAAIFLRAHGRTSNAAKAMLGGFVKLGTVRKYNPLRRLAIPGLLS